VFQKPILPETNLTHYSVMINNSPLIFLDSGVGGIPYLDWVRQQLPKENLIYLADTEGFPYGQKDAQQLIELLINRVRMLDVEFSPKAVVLACNTASVVTLDVLRQNFDFPFIGTVPAIKPAASHANRRIGLLATNRTVEEAYTNKLIEDFASSSDVIKRGASELVDFVERDLFYSSHEDSAAFLQPLIADLERDGVDSLVLGCTHFVYLRKLLKNGFSRDVEIFDSVLGVGQQILRILKNVGHGEEGKSSFYTTGGDNSVTREFAARFNLQDLGVLQ